MSLRQQAKILGVSVTYLSLMKNGKRPWKPEIKARYDQLVNSLPESVYNNGSNGSARTAPTIQSQSLNVMVSRVGLEPTTLGLKDWPRNSVLYFLLMNSACQFAL